jgi:hypothetical protein
VVPISGWVELRRCGFEGCGVKWHRHTTGASWVFTAWVQSDRLARAVRKNHPAAHSGWVGGALRAPVAQSLGPQGATRQGRVLYNCGREGQLDCDSIRRLIRSLQRVLPPDEGLKRQAPELRFLEFRPMGGTFLLDGFWRRLGVDEILNRLGHRARASGNFERVCFAMVANRALAPASTLAGAAWVKQETVIPGLAEVDQDQCYRARDCLLAMESEVAKAVYWALADLINLEVDLIFFDTTSTYFDIDQAEPNSEASPGFRRYGHSKGPRPNRPQVNRPGFCRDSG